MKVQGRTVELSAVDVELIDKALATHISKLYTYQKHSCHEHVRLKIQQIINHANCIQQVLKTIETEEQNEKEN